MLFVTWGRFADAGLLVMRVGLGIMFLGHGVPKLLAPEKWEAYGGAMANFGITFWPSFWGFMAGFGEALGGTLLLLGLLFRPACALLLFIMIVAATRHIVGADETLDAFRTFMSASHAIEAGMVFLALLFVGPGRFALDAWIARRCCADKRQEQPTRATVEPPLG